MAESLDGPWVKKNGPVIIGDEWWGVGQASAMAVNGTQILLTYTRGNGSAFNGQMRSVLDFADVARPTIVQPERRITEEGLTLSDGRPGSGGFTNAAMIYDPFNARFWTLREGKPMPATGPVSSSVQLAWIPAAAILPSVATAARGKRNSHPNSQTLTAAFVDLDKHKWTVASLDVAIAPALANRTHNPGLVSNIFGHRSDPHRLEGMVTGMGDQGPDGLFTYRPFSVSWSVAALGGD